MDSGCGHRNRSCCSLLGGPSCFLGRRRGLGCDSAASLRWNNLAAEPAFAHGLRLRGPYARRSGASHALPAASTLLTRITHPKWSGCSGRLRLLGIRDRFLRVLLTAIGEDVYARGCSICLELVYCGSDCGDRCDSGLPPNPAYKVGALNTDRKTAFRGAAVRRGPGDGLSLSPIFLAAEPHPRNRGPGAS